MREIRRLAWAAALALAAGSPAIAQQPAGTGTGTSTAGTTGIPTSQTINSTGQTTTNGGGGQGGQGGQNSQGTGQNDFQLNSLLSAPQIIAPSRANSNSNSNIAASNVFANYYGAVYYQGRTPSNVPHGLPGGFGAAMFPSTGGTTGTRGGAQGGQGGAQGGQGGRGGATGGVNTADPGGIIVPLPRQIAYSSQVQFKLPAGNALPQLQSDLRGSIDRVPTNMLANPAGVTVEVDGRSVILRGSVRDDEEARLVEGLVRLTPGVAGIKNELTFPK